MNLSAAELVKRSAAQLWFFTNHPERRKKNETFQKIAGQKFAKQNTKSKYIEMGNYYLYNGHRIYFAIDEVNKEKGKMHLIEHKMVKNFDECPPWYFQNSLIQVAFYGALTNRQTKLRSAKFTGQSYEIRTQSRMYSKLNFGGKWYTVTYDAEPVMDFFMKKIRALESYKQAKAFDTLYKHREWEEHFKKYIRYRKVNRKHE
jgi:hypothetical protein